MTQNGSDESITSQSLRVRIGSVACAIVPGVTCRFIVTYVFFFSTIEIQDGQKNVVRISARYCFLVTDSETDGCVFSDALNLKRTDLYFFEQLIEKRTDLSLFCNFFWNGQLCIFW